MLIFVIASLEVKNLVIALSLVLIGFSFLELFKGKLEKNYNLKFRDVDVPVSQYLKKEFPLIVIKFVSITFFVVALHFLNIYYAKYADFLAFLFYYSILIFGALFLAGPLQSAISTRIIDNELTKRFGEYARMLGFRDVRIYCVPWTRFKTANAFQMGGALNYYVYATDYLLDNLSPDETDFVILHELFHARKKHILKLIIFASLIPFLLMATKLIPFGLIGNPLVEIIAVLSYTLSVPGLLPLLLAYMGRRFETEADLYAVKFSGKPAAASSALKKLSELNMIPASYGKYRLLKTHPSVEERIKRINEEMKGFQAA